MIGKRSFSWQAAAAMGFAFAVQAALAEEGGEVSAPVETSTGVVAPAATPGPPTLEHLREILVRRGVPPRLARIERAAPEADDSGRVGGGVPRLVFWVKTKRLLQTIVVAVTACESGGGAYVRVQSAGLARAPAGHTRLAELMVYMLDRNFVMSGVQFARDATDGEVVLRADVPCAGGADEALFIQAVESVLRAADEEAPRLGAILSGSS